MATATLTYVTGVNAATNYVRVGHNSKAINNDAVWSFSLAASTGVAKWTGVKFTLKWNNTSAGTGWSGSYSYVFAVSSSGSAGRTAQSGTVLGRTTTSLSGSSGTATVTITGLSLTPGTTYYLRANQNGSTYSTMKAFQKASNTCESTANTWTTGTIYYNAGTAWLPQTGQVGGTANGSQYCKSLISALGHTHFASANGSSALTETYNYNSTAYNAYNSTTLFNPPAGYRHSPEATQLLVYDYTKGTWLNHSGASAASINFRNYSLNWGDTIVMFTNWLINTLTVNYHANGGSFGTQSGTTRYRVSSNLIQQSTNSGSSWTTLSTTGNINSNVDCHNVTTSGYGGGLKKTGYHVNAGAEFNTKADGTGVNVNQDNGSTNVPSVYRINGNANLTDNKTITLYVNWKPNTYTVTFNRNGGPANGSSSVTVTYAAAMPSATMPTRQGYTFAGYYDAASGGTQYYTAAGASARTWNKTADTILYAHWTKNNYTLTFDANGGECSETSRTVAYNTNIDDLPVPTRSGYKFVGWGHDFNGSQQATWGRDMMYTNQISIHLSAYMDNWNLYGSTPMRMISCTEGAGWNIEPSASGSSYKFNFLFWDAGASGYKSTLSSTLMSELDPGWHTFDMIFDGTNVKGYIDGILEGTSANFSGAIGYHSTNGIFLGCEAVASETTGGAPYFTGSIVNITIRNNTTLLPTDTYTSITSPAGNWTLKAYWEELPNNYIKLYTISNNTPTSTITNLTNTTWYFNEDLTNTTANAEYDITFNSNNTAYEQLITVSDTYIVYNPDTVYYGGQKWFNENFRTIEITGGTDITSQQLISWLYDNATLYSSPQWVDIELQTYIGSSRLTDLSGTTWYMNDEVDAFITGSSQVQITGTIGSDNIGNDGIGVEEGFIYNWTGSEVWFEDGWNDPSYRNWTITNGTDTTRTTFIDWMYENGTLVSSSQPPYVKYPVKIYTLDGWKTVQS